MSRSKRRLSVIIGGVAHEIVEKYDRPTLVGTSPGRSHWLAQGYDPFGHLLVLLVANVPAAGRSPGLMPLVYTMPTGHPSYVLLPDALGAAFCSGLDGETPEVTQMGTPRARVPVFCTACRVEFDLYASALQATRGPKPGEPGRFTLGMSHSADVGQR